MTRARSLYLYHRARPIRAGYSVILSYLSNISRLSGCSTAVLSSWSKSAIVNPDCNPARNAASTTSLLVPAIGVIVS
jgi:hypothetical protein